MEDKTVEHVAQLVSALRSGESHLSHRVLHAEHVRRSLRHGDALRGLAHKRNLVAIRNTKSGQRHSAQAARRQVVQVRGCSDANHTHVEVVHRLPSALLFVPLAKTVLAHLGDVHDSSTSAGGNRTLVSSETAVQFARSVLHPLHIDRGRVAAFARCTNENNLAQDNECRLAVNNAHAHIATVQGERRHVVPAHSRIHNLHPSLERPGLVIRSQNIARLQN